MPGNISSDYRDLMFSSISSLNFSDIENMQNGVLVQIYAEKIACGCYHSMVLDSKGYVFSFGRGNHG